MIRICTVVGARPQFVKAAAVSAEFARRKDTFEETIIHTGQHYDPAMSDIFFKELGIPKEKYNLSIGSGSHGAQTGKMLEGIEGIIAAEKPDVVLVYGDTNSTIAGALAAVKLHVRSAHVEAGMRSFNRRMPEEINRVVADHICDVNYCSCEAAVRQLADEGRGHTAILSGDVMFDCALGFAAVAEAAGNDPLATFGLSRGGYILATCHRPENTDSPAKLAGIMRGLGHLAEKWPVILPLHPRTARLAKEHGMEFAKDIMAVEPVGYLDMLLLEKNAACVVTDSGGVQKEAFFYGVPCVTTRQETEWTETVDLGWNKVVGSHPEAIEKAVSDFIAHKPAPPLANPYGDGKACAKIADHLSG